MLSGNGRHRRPRQAPALVVAAGVAGSAIAIPLFAASGASAATTQAWDKLAECESGGQWSLDAGNGYYGGLQFTQERWEQYGGLDYAPRADQASRSQQISVAEKVLDAKGVSAWPMCSLTSGLTNDDDSANVDPGVSASPQPSESSSDTDAGDKADEGVDESADNTGSTDATDSADSANPEDSTDSADSGDKGHDDPEGSDPSDAPSAGESGDTSGNQGEDSPSPSSDKSHAPSDDAASETASPSASPSGEAPDDATSGRHRGDRAADDDGGGSDSRTGEGRHASRDDKRAGDTYEVHAGDSLWGIAKAQDVHGGWDALYERNKETVGTDPDLILPGQSLDLGDGSDKR
ncbi:transglycosylase family protein [Streptomyces endophyticus]|uniref:Transglycosylase family protein n=1 Tax=Streptomyces endophyticus TaxID=714166 RepID=A0ABU6FAA2_9ACTN|nr:transglycosylase family protein [Streptomyces endophyticus]MEB8340973.1 transglycosylase family protein [Streptomyces endophyticus]